jgi:hypothetical protein
VGANVGVGNVGDGVGVSVGNGDGVGVSIGVGVSESVGNGNGIGVGVCAVVGTADCKVLYQVYCCFVIYFLRHPLSLHKICRVLKVSVR